MMVYHGLLWIYYGLIWFLFYRDDNGIIDNDGIHNTGFLCIYPPVKSHNIAIEIVEFPIQHGDFPQLC